MVRYFAVLMATCAPVFCMEIAHKAAQNPLGRSAGLGHFLSYASAPPVVRSYPVLAIQDVSVIEVQSHAVRQHMTVIIEGGSISAMGPAASTFVPKDAQVVNGQNQFLIPGLWDMDVHLWYKENQLPVFVAFGVTGVQDTGSDFDRVSAWRKAIERGEAVGPRVVTSGPAVAGRESPGSIPAGDGRLPVLLARTATEARRAFDRLYELDTDFIEVQKELSRDAYFALAEMARHWNMRLVGPIPSSISSGEAIEARQGNVEDLFGVSRTVTTEPEAIQLFERCAAYGVRLSPALTFWQRMAHMEDQKRKQDPSLKYVPAVIRNGWPADAAGENAVSRDQVQGAYRLVELMKRTKVQVLAGTHTGDPYTVPGSTLHDELEQLVAAGLTPAEALESATIAPARFFEWDRTMGTVERGKVADLVLLGANPLDDIRNTRKISGVFTRGKYHSRKNLDAILAAVQ
jgi:imidazolonepropionase-like amidohydrolase